MDDRHVKEFKSISDGIKNKRQDSQSSTRECARVLDEIIRPAIKHASQHIEVPKGERIEYNFSKDPSISTPYGQRLYFACRGDSVIITTKAGGDSINDAYPTSELSEGLVLDKIVRFFKMVYDLPSLE